MLDLRALHLSIIVICVSRDHQQRRDGNALISSRQHAIVFRAAGEAAHDVCKHGVDLVSPSAARKGAYRRLTAAPRLIDA
ncbi:hypothetical protein [Terricaulis silvestris]|uniref:hypothetical protein n=1 Tax=Terricaulis silvestris TaxID=2686094 RepID=UPI001E49955C|nr:hypothetical protein [Terricaulis silvestris]